MKRPHPPEALLTPGQRIGVRIMAVFIMLFGASLLYKAGLTLMEGTAWDYRMSASREAQPFSYWSFVVTLLVLGVAVIWFGVSMWRTR